jgi:hypothetical protein
MRKTPTSAQIAALARMPHELRAAIDGFPEALRTVRAPDGSFSLVEHVCHLRDLEREGYRQRVELMLCEDRPALADIDGAALAAARAYQDQDIEQALTDFSAARLELIQRLRQLEPRAWHRTGMMEGTGEITVADLFAAMAAHDATHRNDLAELRAALSG